jgi:DNA (cytosine-5)-methyltransferase 1
VRPRLLDTFCCEGGASVGYDRAGFDVTGVDLFKHVNAKGKRVGFSQKRYPFPSIQADAVQYIRDHGHEYDVIAASPPCQRHSAGTRALDREEYPDLIGPTREALIATGRPYVIENVPEAPLLDPIELCGCMFGLGALDDDGLPLRLERPRRFESSIPLVAPGPHVHDSSVWVAGSYGGARARKPGQTPAQHRHAAKYERHGGYVPPRHIQQRLLGIDWMTTGGMHQSLPPVYTEWIGLQLRAWLMVNREDVAA